jgi:hypothetical protein
MQAVHRRRARRPGRVHRVILAAEPREVLIEARFDRTLRSTAGDVRLEYEDEDAENEHRLEDAARVGQILDASDLLLVTAESDEVARIDWVRMPDQVVASVRVSIGPSGVAPESLTRAIDALSAGRSVDATGDEDEEMAAWVPPARAGTEADGSPANASAAAGGQGRDGGGGGGGGGASAVGWILGGVGVATFGAAWGLQIVWFNRRDQANIAEPTDPDYQDRLDRRDAMVLPVALLGAGAALATTAALPFLVGEDGAAWWHWALGGAGVVAAAVGIGLWTQEGKCNDALCSERSRTVPLAPLVVTMAVPLLAVPIMALIMKSGEDAPPNDLTLLPTVGPEGAGLVLGGTL